MKKQLWVWSWIGGGWNHCYAFTRKEAVAIAKKKGHGVLIPLKASVRLAEVKDEISGENL